MRLDEDLTLSRLTQELGALAQAVRTPLHDLPVAYLEGKVTAVTGLSVALTGMTGFTGVGDRVTLAALDGREIDAEIVGFRDETAIAMPFGALDGIGAGCRALFPLLPSGERQKRSGANLVVNDHFVGRVIDPMGKPIDGKAPLSPSGLSCNLRASPPDAASRARLGPRMSLGVSALDLFATCRQGQRLGLFAGSGVGKSTLMGMLTRNSACDIAVIALVGERGREVREFLEDDLGEEGLSKAVVVVATSDSPPLMRREAAYTATTIAEYFRDQGKSVLLLMDSVTRFCHALREIGLSGGEPPATRGYPPSVFAELPRLLERAGPGLSTPDGRAGQITAIYSVLVEGDDHNEPVADAVRGILDGHVIMDRRIAEAGRYPAINVLRSLSRTASGCNTREENALTREARATLAVWEDIRDIVQLGAYREGSDAKSDRAIRLAPEIDSLLQQERMEVRALSDSFLALSNLVAAYGGPQ
ncbi:MULTISPECIES: flagellar protein export ATPase FliI [Asaia]|uniref:Flagellum-specific ATP synthase n=1 Tax=Asaia bogorensis TaxID=91915 RepID=A0A060QHB4_9PROT|nr:flagellar protein export ATPase FliI [Asaia sp. HumB]MDL2170523.1 flagellar protein export ATPase FliI [Asaia sp. HumB]CDG40554.1 Flagellum-specific ATP synthase FliI [Asaia bogorensis]